MENDLLPTQYSIEIGEASTLVLVVLLLLSMPLLHLTSI